MRQEMTKKIHNPFIGKRFKGQYFYFQTIGIPPILLQLSFFLIGASLWIEGVIPLFLGGLALIVSTEFKMINYNLQYRRNMILFFGVSSLIMLVSGVLSLVMATSEEFLVILCLICLVVDLIWCTYSWRIYKEMYIEANGNIPEQTL
jgi:hypothetical protein